ncbi:MAG: signal recognition particle protein, partial [Clostridia bacterium]|nr:signal recognition particle protein [Clostridia bacterium]
MFQSLTEKLANAFKRFRNKGKLTEADVREGMREVKRALLEADVNFKVVRDFISEVTERAVGQEVLESLLPAQQIVKIVNEELVKLMGSETAKLEISPKPPTVIMMAGLQGAGKTTHAAKIAKLMKSKGKNPLLVACDIYRPAAIDQLKIVGEAAGIPVFSLGNKVSPVEIAKAGVEHAKKNGFDMVFLDTAGRLHIDDELMEELEKIRDQVEPTEILLVVDAMLGQDAVNVAKTFNERLELTGVVLTKLDGDTRGGAALSVRYVTGKPIKFIGTGEKLDMIEQFHPDRMASRILGMGDVLSLIEKAEAAYDAKTAAEMEKKLREQTFTLEDFLVQLRQLKKMGNLEQILGMMPGVNASALKDANIDEKQTAKTEAIVLSMTKQERMDPSVIGGSRRRRIAKGSGTTVEDVN